MMKRTLSLFLAVALCFTMLPMPAAAAEHCHHHEVHTDTCGYVEAVAGSDCAHSHDAACGYAEAVAEVLCACETTDESGALVHTEGCGYAAPVTGADCTHSHDGFCGYVQAVSGSECAYFANGCPDCAAEAADPTEEPTEPTVGDGSPVPETTEPPVPVCACGTDDPAIHATNCPRYAAPENPVCYCAEKCTEDTLNVWCDVCGAQGVEACKGGEDAAVPYESYNIWVGGVQVGGTPDASGNIAVTGDTITGTVAYAPSTGTLTLDGASITAAATPVDVDNNPPCGIYSESDLNLVLTGANTITASTTDYSAGVMADAMDLTIGGGGSLKINNCGYGINALKLVTNGVTIEIIGSVYAISLTTDCTIEESTVSAVGSKKGISTADGLIKIDDSSVYAKGEEHSFHSVAGGVPVSLSGGAHVKAEGTISTNIGVSSDSSGYLRGVSGSSFEYKEAGRLEYSGTYFEYVGEGHYTFSPIADSEEHTIACKDENCILKLANAAEPHSWNAHADGATCDICRAAAAFSVTDGSGTVYYMGTTFSDLTAAITKGSAVKLYTNLSGGQLSIGTPCTLDLNGYTITVSFNLALYDAEFTVCNGTIRFSSTVSGHSALAVDDAMVTLENITISGESVDYGASVGGRSFGQLIIGKNCVIGGKTASINVGAGGIVSVTAEPAEGTTYSVYMGTPGTFAYSMGGYLKYFTSAVPGYVVVKDGDNLKLAKGITADMVEVVQSAIYNGSQQNPKVTVTWTDGSVLTEGQHYAVGYKDSKGDWVFPTDAGTYTVVVTGMNDYAGEVEKTYTIAKATLTAEGSGSASGTYGDKLSDLTVSGLTAKLGDTEVPGTWALTGGTVPNVGDSGTYTATFTPTSGADNYEPLTARVPLSITAKELDASDVSGVKASYTYTGSPIKPTVTVMDGTAKLTEGTDYEVIYGENTTVAQGGTVTITFKGNYSGNAVEKTFTIDKAKVTITADDVIVPLNAVVDLTEYPYTVSGLCGDDILTDAPEFWTSTNIVTGMEMEYTIIPKDASAGPNYVIEYKEGKLKVRGPRTITVAADANGKVSVSHTSAIEGTQVTITVTPNSGYKFSTLVVTDASGKQVAVSTDNNGKYGFTMPYSNVTVKATFASTSTGIADPTNPKTGDNFRLMLWSSILGVSAICLLAAFADQKRKRTK